MAVSHVSSVACLKNRLMSAKKTKPVSLGATKAKAGSHPRQKRRGCVAPRRMWTQHSRYVQQSINSTASEEHTTLTILDKKTALSQKFAQIHLQQYQYQFFHWKNPLQSVIASTAAGEKTRLTRGGWKRRGWVEGREDPCTQR